MLSLHLAMPREGHFYAALHIMAYLRQHHNSWMIFDPTYPDINYDETAHKSWGNLEPHTYIDGTGPIDAVYHSPEIKITATMQLSFHEGVGDHRTVLVDVSSRSLIGKYDFKMLVRSIAQRLTTSNSSAMKCYIHYIEREVKARNLHSQLCDISLSLITNSHDSSAL